MPLDAHSNGQREGVRHDPTKSTEEGHYLLTEGGNARRLVALHGADLRHCDELGGWLTWDYRRWRRDRKEAVRRAKDIPEEMLREAAELDGDARKTVGRHALNTDSAKGIQNMLKMAESDPLVTATSDQFDTDPWALNVLNGTLNLRTGKLRPHCPEDMITKLASVNFDSEASCPTWDKFLSRVLPDPEVRAFVQRAVGYSLTASTGEQIMLLLYGSGNNGKSTFLEAIRAMLGDYAQQTPAETLLRKRQGAIPNDVARLRGARFVTAVETDEGRSMAEVLVKQLTGGDTLSARFMRGEWFEFRPDCKIWLATNHKPVVRGTDDAIWRRIRLVPFTFAIPKNERDKDLTQRLCNELPGILNWALEGCSAWQKDGLGVPEGVRTATDTYRAEMDEFGAFLAECCLTGESYRTYSRNLRCAYEGWCDRNGEKPLTTRAFALRLSERGFKSKNHGRTRRRAWIGVGLIEPIVA